MTGKVGKRQRETHAKYMLATNKDFESEEETLIIYKGRDKIEKLISTLNKFEILSIVCYRFKDRSKLLNVNGLDPQQEAILTALEVPKPDEYLTNN